MSGSGTAQLTAQLHTVDEQKELFLWKYRDVKREDVQNLLKVCHFFLFRCVSSL
jgi:hypothetical protein